MTGKENDDTGTFASPPCYMHELDPAYWGMADEGSPQQIADLKRWRKAERERLIKERLAVTAKARRQYDAAIMENLKAAIGRVDGLVVSAYSPFRGEPNLRPFLKEVIACGGRCALPVVIARGEPLIFRSWTPGDKLARGVWNIPIPRESAGTVVPDVVIAPVVGFDPACYRLGYGGGFYDRTLAALPNETRVFGVGYAPAAIPTIYPQWHDIPMGCVVTERGVVTPETGAGPK